MKSSNPGLIAPPPPILGFLTFFSQQLPARKCFCVTDNLSHLAYLMDQPEILSILSAFMFTIPLYTQTYKPK